MTVAAGSYNSPSVQPQTASDRVKEQQAAQARAAQANRPAQQTPENNRPTVNIYGQTVGTLINTKA